MATVLNGISVSVQYENFHTILYKQFFSIQLIFFWSRSLSVNAPLLYIKHADTSLIDTHETIFFCELFTRILLRPENSCTINIFKKPVVKKY